MHTEPQSCCEKEVDIGQDGSKDIKVSNVFVVPGASSRKLPFLHSKFKSRSKFAKTFNGCSRFSKLKARDESWRLHVHSKLPCIKFEENARPTKTRPDSIKHGLRREYPGFAGNNKVRVRRENRTYITTKNGMFFTGLTLDPETSLNPTTEKETLQACSRGDSNHTFINKEDTLHLLPDLESLFIIDDSESETGSKTHQIDPGNGGFPSCTSEAVLNEDAIIENDFFAKGVNRKLIDASQKSGMKKMRNYHKDADVRLLGDVLTTERFRELLSPRRTLPPLKFQ